jgi:hypothetical protein
MDRENGSQGYDGTRSVTNRKCGCLMSKTVRPTILPKDGDVTIARHYGGSIKYVGKSGSPSMSYGMRLRREFQETASGGKHIYPKLALLSVPPDIMVSFFSAKDIERLVTTEGMSLNSFEKIEVFETAAIHAYQPEFQRHHVTRMRTQLRKLKIPEAAAEAMLSVFNGNR